MLDQLNWSSVRVQTLQADHGRVPAADVHQMERENLLPTCRITTTTMSNRFEIRGVVQLEKPLVLATSGRPNFPALQVHANGVTVRVALDLSPDKIQALDAQWRGHQPEDATEFWLNTPVDCIHVCAELAELPEDDRLRLEGRHPTAQRTMIHSQTYQEATALGARIGTAMAEVLTDLVRILRSEFGQYWLRPVPLTPDPVFGWGPAFAAIRAEWRIGNKEWRPFRPSNPNGITITTTLNAWNQYLSPADWGRVCAEWDQLNPPNVAFALLFEARESYANGELQLAVIHLSSALDWTVQRFLQDSLAHVIPEQSLQTILKQSYSRVLGEWVRPLADQKGLNLEQGDWSLIRRLQELRRTAAHPALTGSTDNSNPPGFLDMWYAGVRTIRALLGAVPAKIPPDDELPSGSMQGGWVRERTAASPDPWAENNE